MLIDKFIKTQIYKLLFHRENGFVNIIKHLDKSKFDYIIETGTARQVGNWQGDGQSTIIWDWIAKQTKKKVYSIDIDQGFIDISKNQTEKVNYICGDSVKTLNEMPKHIIQNTAVLYLDSFDWSPELALNSCIHHLMELTTVWSNLPKGCLIVVDDKLNETQGKHVLIQHFMQSIGLKPLFDGYQIGWIK